MNAKYIPIKIGNSGEKVHIGIVKGERLNRFGRTEMVIWQMCGVVNTKHINRPVSLSPLKEGTPITCDRCLAKLERLQAAELASNIVAA